MAKRKYRNWKFSDGGGSLFATLLFLPLLIGLGKVLAKADALPVLLLIIGFLLGLIALIWFIGLRPLLTKNLWKHPRTWYEGLFGIGGLYFFYAVFVLVAGKTPSRYHSISIDRSSFLCYLEYALIPILFGFVALILEKRRKNGDQ